MADTEIADPGLHLPQADPRRPVPWRTILAVLAVVVITYLGFLLMRELSRLVAWLVVAAFFTIVLSPAVDIVQRRLRLRRGFAAAMVFLLVLGVVGGALYAFIRPVVGEVSGFVDDLPGEVQRAQEGEGRIGRLLARYDLDQRLEENQEEIQTALRRAAAPALDIVRTVFNTVFALLTILVLTFLMLMRGPELCTGALSLFPAASRDRIRLVAADCARAVSGYVAGLFLINVIAGVCTYAFLRIAGVPNAEVLALFVAFATLIPLVGATLGAIPVIGFSFLHSVPAGIAAVIFYIVYQQFENNVLQPTILSRTVNVNPLAVIVSVLAGVELFGFLGAFLAIPFAGVIQVVLRNVYDERRGKLKAEPTVGASETPLSQVHDDRLPPATGEFPVVRPAGSAAGSTTLPSP